MVLVLVIAVGIGFCYCCEVPLTLPAIYVEV
jgi:hypothetical protein